MAVGGVVKYFVLAAAIAGGYYLYRRQNRPKCPRSIVAVGDSITAGGYLDYIEDEMPECSFKAFGYPGKGTAFIHGKLGPALVDSPDDVIILAGVNDIASGRTVESVKTHLLDMYRDAQAGGARVIAVTILPWRGYDRKTAEVNRWILSEPLGTTAVDTSAMGNESNGLDKSLSADNLHPNASGKRLLAEIIHNAAY